MFKRAMIGLFAISVVAMLWTEANAQGCPFEFTYCFDAGGSLICGCYNEGSLIAIGRITCPTSDPGCIKAPVTLNAEFFGTVEDPAIPSGPCEPTFNKECAMTGTLDCNGVSTPTTLFPSDDPNNHPNVTFPLTATAHKSCNSGSCTLTAVVDLGNCAGNAANCCHNCCPSGTPHMTFTPSSFNANETYSQPPGAKSGPSEVTVKSADCSLDPETGRSTCDNSCTFSCGGEGPCSCTPCSFDTETGVCSFLE
jgi:hypothetical protein